MVFSSLHFLFIFLPVTLLLYFVVPFRAKNVVLLLASIFFYAWGEPVYVILMLLNIVFNYIVGLQFAASSGRNERKRQLVIAVIVNLLLLGFFKYAGFLVHTVNGLFHASIVWKELPLPIGISFYTFQALSYVIDAYHGRVQVQKNFISFATYITMFPQLIAGPIVTYSRIEHQLDERRISLLQAGAGIERMILGLSKKVILANHLGALFTAIQTAPERSVLTAWLGLVVSGLQIYFDFSGYSDMAIGMGKMLGFDFPENFDYPFLARNITELWRKWHMTLSGWFRNYVYIPMGGNRVGAGRNILNIMVVWFLTGLWHGAGWNYVLWGLYFGVLLILEKYILIPLCGNVPVWLKRVYTLVLFAFSFVLFSNTDFQEMGRYMGNLFGAGANALADSAFWYYMKNHLILLVLSVISCSKVLRRLLDRVSRKSAVAGIGICLLLFVICCAFLVYGSYNPFLYFRF